MPAGEKSKEFKDIKQKSKGKKIIKLIIILLVLGALIGAAVAILVFNVFNIRDAHLRGALETIPGVSNLLPPLEYVNGEPIPATVGELQQELILLQSDLITTQGQLTQANDLNLTQAQDIINLSERITELEARHLELVANEEAFARMVAEEVPQDFVQFFQSINPDLQEEIFREIIGEQHVDEELRNYINIFENMSARQAATALEEMISADLELVITILSNLSISSQASIIPAMEVPNQALVLVRLEPQQ